ncbi:MAG: TetR/AcrR family transcriptional regulator [Actinobacteria bacterium]|nr:TetR/AcrR family transcriptional regulator [Actinomycetota bacterium]MCA1720026.1 TetR/AcrR family transcriptional regulator [Actinomycetota bacterium]
MHPCIDPHLLDAAAAVIARDGYGGLTLVRLAEAAGTSRMTLHRREVTLPAVVAGLSMRAAAEFRAALFPVLAGTGPARERMTDALAAVFGVADRHLPLLAGLFADDDGIFHAAAGPDGALPTDPVFVAPFARILADGEADGTLRPQLDRDEAAAVLFNAAGWGYVQLRHAQRWPPARARDGVLALVMGGLDV